MDSATDFEELQLTSQPTCGEELVLKLPRTPGPDKGFCWQLFDKVSLAEHGRCGLALVEV